MRFLHLSDLHLGKRVCEFSMLDDQRYILEEILSLLDTRPVDAVLLAGDLYDKPVPPAEAVRLLDWFLTELADRKLPVFAISGNHDSAERVAFGAHLLAGNQVYVSPVFEGAPAPIPLTDVYGPVAVSPHLTLMAIYYGSMVNLLTITTLELYQQICLCRYMILMVMALMRL